ncbi:MAG: DUF4347 domain-containing protein [Merismopedia sp. SIO2A8]|nr:DUF4347 domain-containing protein [Merismopedia sp. SIO2A8]
MTHFLFIDASVDDSRTLQAHVNPGTIVHRISDDVDGVEYITQTLNAEYTRSQYDEDRASDTTLSIAAHGTPGVLHLGNAVLSLANLNRYRDRIQQWFSGKPLSVVRRDRLQLYSCDVAASAAGQELIHHLCRITYATVYASSTKMGNAQRGGNWNFDTLLSWNTRLVPLMGYSQPPAPQSPFDSKVLATYPGILAASTPTRNTFTGTL